MGKQGEPKPSKRERAHQKRIFKGASSSGGKEKVREKEGRGLAASGLAGESWNASYNSIEVPLSGEEGGGRRKIDFIQITLNYDLGSSVLDKHRESWGTLLAGLMLRDLDATSRLPVMNFELMTLQLKISKIHALVHYLIQGHIGGDETVSFFDKEPILAHERLRATLRSWHKGGVEHQKARSLYIWGCLGFEESLPMEKRLKANPISTLVAPFQGAILIKIYTFGLGYAHGFGNVKALKLMAYSDQPGLATVTIGNSLT
ncbi:hypothetical protein VNO77_22837 [Canavalia gladiata]|uniref:Uncharacterized protein n=1 Tax=Canavalia gladiata TaxID=3824 RepID=A0AAN9L3C5_CANGL